MKVVKSQGDQWEIVVNATWEIWNLSRKYMNVLCLVSEIFRTLLE